MARALVLQFIAGYSCAPASITLDLDHTDDATYGQQPLSFYNHIPRHVTGEASRLRERV